MIWGAFIVVGLAGLVIGFAVGSYHGSGVAYRDATKMIDEEMERINKR